jgi:hypothetical protein
MLTSRVGSSKVVWEREELHDHLGDLTRPDRLYKGQSPPHNPSPNRRLTTRNGPEGKRLNIRVQATSRARSTYQLLRSGHIHCYLSALSYV